MDRWRIRMTQYYLLGETSYKYVMLQEEFPEVSLTRMARGAKVKVMLCLRGRRSERIVSASAALPTKLPFRLCLQAVTGVGRRIIFVSILITFYVGLVLGA